MILIKHTVRRRCSRVQIGISTFVNMDVLTRNCCCIAKFIEVFRLLEMFSWRNENCCVEQGFSNVT
jgi:hypothetical protein